MEILVTAPDTDESGDTLRSAFSWLREEDDLRGRVHLRQAPPQAGQMGSPWEAIVVAALSAGGAVPVLINTLGTWIRNQRTTLKLEVKIGETSIVIDADRVKANPDEIGLLLDKATRAATHLEITNGDATG
ncbi:hypothetical protein V5P93_000758 [Actinokineospora auranticolor]|uniref:Uncharacterized protein n=1 Tax=Actinokineospora auranticolor TaxID=155976 RepID=A0A2S6GYN4_9PSEU|nr:hypothetical protein [Actinokineospora auranticolor]PPK70362.1 hypothetical protein CLV40_102275 [Actinokineospora auranticolor]